MTDRDLASQAIRLETKALETASTIIKALLDALSDKSKNPKDKAVLDEFKDHVNSGKQLLSCPINENRLADFIKEAEKAGLTYTSFQERGRQEIRIIMFKDTDNAVMQRVIDEMTKDGSALVDDMEMTAEKLIDGLGNSGLDITTGLKSKDEMTVFKVSANKNKLPFAFSMESENNVIALTASRDFEKLKHVDGFAGLTTSHYIDNEKKSAIEHIKEGIKERELEAAKSKDKGKGRDYVKENVRSR